MIMSKAKEDSASRLILEYLRQQNRPYSAIDIFNNLHKAHGKTLVVKTLDSLAADGKIRSKNYGKQVVYVADQNQLPEVDDAELKQMDGKIASLSDTYTSCHEQCKQKEAELKGLNSAITTSDAKQQLTMLTAECENYTQRLESLKGNAKSVSPEERKAIMGSRETMCRAWRKRKRIASDMLNAILEGYPKSKKDLYEEIGIETDEEYNVKPPDL